jgi:hypothetical protein
MSWGRFVLHLHHRIALLMSSEIRRPVEESATGVRLREDDTCVGVRGLFSCLSARSFLQCFGSQHIVTDESGRSTPARKRKRRGNPAGREARRWKSCFRASGNKPALGCLVASRCDSGPCHLLDRAQSATASPCLACLCSSGGGGPRGSPGLSLRLPFDIGRCATALGPLVFDVAVCGNLDERAGIELGLLTDMTFKASS